MDGVIFETDNEYMNLVGNVLGVVGYENIYQSGNCFDGYKGIYCFPNVNINQTILRHGNWDSFHNGVLWDGGISNHILPNSYYLSSKPSWWCQETPWPPIGPDVAGYYNPIPAMRKYNGQACTP